MTYYNIPSDDLYLYRSYLNDFLTVDRFAEYYGFTRGQAEIVIALGREEHNALAALHN